jgi:hypothetical protein
MIAGASEPIGHGVGDILAATLRLGQMLEKVRAGSCAVCCPQTAFPVVVQQYAVIERDEVREAVKWSVFGKDPEIQAP